MKDPLLKKNEKIERLRKKLEGMGLPDSYINDEVRKLVTSEMEAILDEKYDRMKLLKKNIQIAESNIESMIIPYTFPLTKDPISAANPTVTPLTISKPKEKEKCKKDNSGPIIYLLIGAAVFIIPILLISTGNMPEWLIYLGVILIALVTLTEKRKRW